jgi:hypothetical protein
VSIVYQSRNLGRSAQAPHHDITRTRYTSCLRHTITLVGEVSVSGASMSPHVGNDEQRELKYGWTLAAVG